MFYTRRRKALFYGELHLYVRGKKAASPCLENDLSDFSYLIKIVWTLSIVY